MYTYIVCIYVCVFKDYIILYIIYMSAVKLINIM